MSKFMTKCSLCGKTVVVDPITINTRYGIKCEACKKKIASRLAGSRGK